MGSVLREAPDERTRDEAENRGGSSSTREEGQNRGNTERDQRAEGDTTRIWEDGKWKRSVGSKRRVYIPEENRGAKRYGKTSRRTLELITYNAMYAADRSRIWDISQALPGAVVGVQGAKQRRDAYEPECKTRKRVATWCMISRICQWGRRRVPPGRGGDFPAK